MAWSKLSKTEIDLAKKWYIEDGESVGVIATRLGRDFSTMSRLLVQRQKRKADGRPQVLSIGKVDQLEKKLEVSCLPMDGMGTVTSGASSSVFMRGALTSLGTCVRGLAPMPLSGREPQAMIRKADGQYEVTVGMLKRSSRCKASERTILRKLHNRGIYFRPLRQKPTLTADDVSAREKFAAAYGKKPASWWNAHVNLIIDVKHFRVLPHGSARRHAAQEATRGTYRKKGKGLAVGHTKPVIKSKYNPGGPGVKVLAGVGNGKVLVWEYLDGPWGGSAAAEAYRGPIKKALQRTFPGRKSFVLLEDNDPSGFKSSLGMAAKDESKIRVLEIPKRSPCLNVCDYFLWAEVSRRMRQQEQKFAPEKRETRPAFLARMRRTAFALPPDVVASAVADMKRRCARLVAAKGGNIEEGGGN